MSEKENVYIKNITKNATLNIEVDAGNEFENAVIEVTTVVELSINDKTITFTEDSRIYNVINKTLEEISSELDDTFENITKHAKERALKLESIINFTKGYCKANNISFNIKIV